MKNRLKFGLVTYAAASLVSLPVHADTVITSQSGTAAGDLILDFTQTGGTENLEVDLGPYNQFLPGGTVPTLTNYLNTADLVSAFGSNWDSSSDNVFWSVVGYTGSHNISPAGKFVLFGTEANNAAVPVADGNNSTNGGNLVSFLTEISNLTATGDSNDHATIYGNGNTNSYDEDSGIHAVEGGGGTANTEPAGGFFGFPDLGTNFQNQTNGGTSSSALYEIDNNSGDNGVDLGTFSLGPSGLSFQSASIPEPSTLASIVLGAASLVALRHRRRHA
jgi:hypothetical protein